jgi:hypothetical protein
VREMKYARFFLPLLISVLAVSCVESRIAPYPGFNYTPTNPNTVQIYNMRPTVQFEIIGEVEGKGAPAASWGSVENYMKKKAASIGGDGIILIARREPYAGTYTTPSSANAFVFGNYIYYTYQPGTSFAMHRKNLIGLVIKWRRER